MDIRSLEYFLAVAQEESITRAAEVLHMTQPPLSREMKALEGELGKQLLIRGSRKVTLTEEGMLLRRRAEELVGLMEKTRMEIHPGNWWRGICISGAGKPLAWSSSRRPYSGYASGIPLSGSIYTAAMPRTYWSGWITAYWISAWASVQRT